MHKSWISIIPLIKAGAHCWEADVDGAKLRNPCPNIKTPRTRIWSLLVIEMLQRAHGLTCLIVGDKLSHFLQGIVMLQFDWLILKLIKSPTAIWRFHLGHSISISFAIKLKIR